MMTSDGLPYIMYMLFESIRVNTIKTLEYTIFYDIQSCSML